MNAEERLRDNLRDALEYIISISKQELRNQGHFNTGNLENSFLAKIRSAEPIGDIYVNDYGLDLDAGVDSSRIDINTQSKILEPWVQSKLNITGKEYKSIAFLIARKQSIEGIPTKNSFKYSTNGRRTGWIDEATSSDIFDEVEKKIDAQGIFQQAIQEFINKL